MTDIKSMNKEELKDLMVQVGEKPFRAKQIYSWLHEHLVTSYEEMGNIPGKLKEKLKEYPITALEMVDEQISAIDGTRKYLFRLSDGNVIESVLMRYKHGNSVCISSQVGCKMGCRFCASTIGGWTRNLLPSEMLDQIYRIQSITGERVSNVVVMGTGEPMDNYDNIVRFVHLLSEEGGLNISQRNITVSTCGIVPKIYELAKEKLQILRHGILHGKIFQKIFFLLREADLVHFPCNGAKHTVYKRLQVIKALALCQLHSFIAHCAVRHAVHIFQLVYRTS